MTYSQIQDIQSPAEGLFVFCTNCGPTGDGSLAMFMGGIWTLMTSSCMPPASPTQQVHIAGSSQITWNWESVPGAIGYRFNTSNNLQTAISLDTNSFILKLALDCSPLQTRFLWAYDDCGNSPVALSQSTAVNPPLAWCWSFISISTSDHLGLDSGPGSNRIQMEYLKQLCNCC
ncbi:MAG: hypothetical protein IPH88_16770 [Bacteroidales bacterium]|nr:hypothetical protein [Bacteroidales bacterium]